MLAFATEASSTHRGDSHRCQRAETGENVAVRMKRAYEAPAADDGYRVLIDRLWPRGRRKEDLRLDAWLRDLAPSNELRSWFGHDPARWPEFRARYRRELREQSARLLLDELVRRARRSTVTLVFAARDTEHSNAAVLRGLLDRERMRH
jgi:uncharacterized protein YeaO (DUF488 family)